MSRISGSHFTKYPICKELWNYLSKHPFQPTKKAGERKNHLTNIVSPGLCDDAIKRLAPSLAQHVGCTIIDINPGVGLWSSKLHDIVKPRSHILVEEDQETYLPFLQPLLDAPGSHYHYRNWSGYDCAHPARYVADGLLPAATESPGGKSPILIIANHGHRKVRDEEHYVGITAVMQALRFVHNLKRSQSFHAYGPTRMLMWMADGDKRTLLPRTVAYRNKVAVAMEMSLHVEEVVGGPPFESKARREDALEIRSGRQVAKRMENEDTVLPPARQLAYEGTFGSSSAGTTRDWHQEYEELVEGFKGHRLSQFVGQSPAPIIDARKLNKKKTDKLVLSPEYKRYRFLKGIFKRHDVNHTKADKYVRVQEEIDRLDMQAHRAGIDVQERNELLNALDAKIDDFKASLKVLPEADLNKIMFLDDDRRAFAMDPPLLLWDRRKAEPIIAEDDEFYHLNKPLALLDFQPKPTRDLLLNERQDDYFDAIATHLMGLRGPATLKHMNKLAPGAYEALSPKVPALRDPTKGGRRDIDFIRNRTLTPEMLHELAMAWDQWLFKPADPRTYLSDD